MEEKEYLDFGGKDFIIDFDSLSDVVRLPPIKFKDEEGNLIEDETGPSIDVTKYEMIREMIGTILNTGEVIDDKLGVMALNQLPIPFKISYNTLIHYDILKEIDDNE
jgi:hypothetical protein